jgi:uncharacterized membrane protein
MPFCPNCGSPADGRFCPKCGAAVAAGATGAGAPGVVPTAGVSGISDNAAGALCYLFGFITGILFLVLAPYNQNRTVRFHAFQSIFLNLAWIVAWIAITIVGIALHVIPILGTILMLCLHFALGIGALIVWLYMMFKTFNGEKIVLPVIGPMAEKQAGTV